MRLKDEVAVITGSNSGIGLGIAEAFKNEGARSTITGRNQHTIDASIQQLGNNFIGLRGDVTHMNDLENIFQTTDPLSNSNIFI
ncbi:SDR family NAD(P)-dependent oxidoreductase [Chitinophaga nivalis]|uniref:SDR family NAD(P)-dependent oxidoreductase n=1 Tax=Chitinophaga nivalis TaxID=2991709 RepID=UPI0027D9ABE5|nr:SDR family NAD(P)-dependent oxidoreductase [Chitinophaga nivalis]